MAEAAYADLGTPGQVLINEDGEGHGLEHPTLCE